MASKLNYSWQVRCFCIHYLWHSVCVSHDQSHVRLGLVNIRVWLDRTACERSPLVAFQHHVEQVVRLLSPQGKYLLSMVKINYKHKYKTLKPLSSLLWSQPWPRQWIPPWEPRRSRATWRTPSPARRTRTLPCCQSGWRPAPLCVINFWIAWSAFILFSCCCFLGFFKEIFTIQRRQKVIDDHFNPFTILPKAKPGHEAKSLQDRKSKFCVTWKYSWIGWKLIDHKSHHPSSLWLPSACSFSL